MTHEGPQLRPLLLLAAWTLASYPLGLLLGVAWLLPLAGALPAWALMAARLRAGRRREAVFLMLGWAALLAVGGTLTFALWPHDPGALVVNGPAYRDEMFSWIRTGVGREGDPRLFLPQHLGHLLLFVATSLASAGLVSMVMGAALMNYMSYYVASLARAGVAPATVALFGWQPWALCRVAAFVTLGVVLAEPLLSRLRPYPYAGLRGARVYLAAAAAGILADWLLKALLAPGFGTVLRAALP